MDLVKALESAKQEVPAELIAVADAFKEKVKRGEARFHGSGFKGKGFTFDESERNETQRAADLQKRLYEIDQGIFIEVSVVVFSFFLGFDSNARFDTPTALPYNRMGEQPTTMTRTNQHATLPLRLMLQPTPLTQLLQQLLVQLGRHRWTALPCRRS